MEGRICEGEVKNLMPGEMMRGEKGGEFSYPHGCVGAGMVQRARVCGERGRPEWWETAEIESDLERKTARWSAGFGPFKGVAKAGGVPGMSPHNPLVIFFFRLNTCH